MQTFLFDDEVEALTEFEAGGPLSEDRLRTLERFATTDFGQQMLSERAPLHQDSEPKLPTTTPQLKFETVEEEPAAPAPAPAEQPRRAPARNPNSRQRPEDMPQDQFQLSIFGPRGMRGSAWLEPFDGLPIDATQEEIKQSLLDRYNDINVVLTEDELATMDDLMRNDTEAAARFFEGAGRIVPALWDMYMGGLKEGYSGALRRYGMGFFGDPRDQIKQDLATAGETGRKVVIQTRQLWNFFSQMFGDVMAANRGTEMVRQELAAAGQLTGNNRADIPIIQQEIQRRREAGDPVFGADQDQEDFQRRYQNYAFNRKLDRAFAGLTSYEQDGVEIMEAPDVVGGTTFEVGGQQPMPNMSTGGAMIFDPVNIAAGYAGAFTKARLLHRFAATSGPVFAGVERGAAGTISFAARKGEQLSSFAQRKTGLTANQLTAISGAGATLGLGLSQVAGVDPETGMPTSSAAASFGRGLFLVSAPLPAIRAAGVVLKTTKAAAGTAAAVTAEAKAGALGIRSALSPTDQASAIRAARPASAQELLATGAVPAQYARFMRPGGAQQAADSTLKRVAQNTQNPESLRRAARFADQIGATTAVRVTDDLFSGAVVGAAMSAPFAIAAPDPETAGAIVGGGTAFGTVGNLVGGKFARMQEFIDADIARMMVDVNAMGGDAAAMFGMPKDQLIRLAGTQGMLANKGADLIPLRTEDYVATVPEASDGIYVPPNPQTGQRRQVFVDLGHSSLRDGTVRISDNGDGWFNVRVEGDEGYVYAFKTSDPTQLTVRDGDKVKAYQPLNKKSPASMVAGEEFIHAVMDSDMFDGDHKLELRGLVEQEYGRDGVQARKRDYAARIVDDRIASGTEDNVGFVYANDLEAKQVAEGTKTISQIRRERGKTTKQRDEMIDETVAELDQASIDRTGDPDAWIKDEILGQTWASLSQSLDLNRLRQGQNPELFTARAAEGVMITSSRALEFFGLKSDPGTGRPLNPPSAVFRENPLTISPVLKKRLIEHVRNYDRYLAGLEDAGSAQPRGVPIARSNSPKDMANSPFVKLRRNPRTGLMENDFMFIDATGTPVFKEQSDINNTERLRRQQVATLGGDKILPNNSAEFGPRRLDNGRVEISGPTLPDKFFLFSHFPEHVRDFARQFQTGRADGMSFIVDYNAIGTRSSGTYRVRNLGNVRAIQREFVPTGFIRSSTDHLLVAGIDMNAVRAAAMKAINKGELDLFNNDMTTLTSDLVTYLDNHKNGRPGEATIGIAKRDMLNGLIGTGTAVQRKANPLYSDLNRSGSVRTFRLDRVNEIKPTGRTGLHFDYDKIKNNRMPRTDAATLVDDGAPSVPSSARGQAMPDAADYTAGRLRNLSEDYNGRDPNMTDQDVVEQMRFIIEDAPAGYFPKSLSDNIEKALRDIDEQYREWGGRDDLRSVERAVEQAMRFADRQGKKQTPRGQATPAQMSPRTGAATMPDFDPQVGAYIIDRGDSTSLPVYQQAERGRPAVDDNGDPKYIKQSYDLLGSPRIARYSGPGPEDTTKPNFKSFAYDITLKGQREINAAIDSGAVDSAANSIVRFTEEAMKNPEIAAGMGWYSRMRENLLMALGEEGRETLSQLLGATSAKTPVMQNFLQAMDAYEGILSGRYDSNRRSYLEMMAAEEGNNLTALIVERGYTNKIREIADGYSKRARQLKGKQKSAALAEAAKLRKLAQKPASQWTKKDRFAIMVRATDMMPMRSNGKKFNANSMAVLKVIGGTWLDNRKSPKTPNFAGNLSGRTVQATIDVWAARFLRETLYAGSDTPWRIQPRAEAAVNNQDFALAQVIMQRAGRKLNMNPDDLQAVLWFAEKHRWDERGWTKNEGAEKSSFDEAFKVFFPEGRKPLTFAEASKIFAEKE